MGIVYYHALMSSQLPHSSLFLGILRMVSAAQAACISTCGRPLADFLLLDAGACQSEDSALDVFAALAGGYETARAESANLEARSLVVLTRSRTDRRRYAVRTTPWGDRVAAQTIAAIDRALAYEFELEDIEPLATVRELVRIVSGTAARFRSDSIAPAVLEHSFLVGLALLDKQATDATDRLCVTRDRARILLSLALHNEWPCPAALLRESKLEPGVFDSALCECIDRTPPLIETLSSAAESDVRVHFTADGLALASNLAAELYGAWGLDDEEKNQSALLLETAFEYLSE